MLPDSCVEGLELRITWALALSMDVSLDDVSVQWAIRRGDLVGGRRLLGVGL
jgi:hypothetical protein